MNSGEEHSVGNMEYLMVQLSRSDFEWNFQFVPDLAQLVTLCRSFHEEALIGYADWAHGRASSRADAPYYGFDFVVILRNERKGAEGFAFLRRINDEQVHIDMICATSGNGAAVMAGVFAICGKMTPRATQISLECRPLLYGFYRSQGFISRSPSTVDHVWDFLIQETRKREDTFQLLKTYRPADFNNYYFRILEEYDSQRQEPIVEPRLQFRESFFRFIRNEYDGLLVEAIVAYEANKLNAIVDDILLGQSQMVKTLTEQDWNRLPTDIVESHVYPKAVVEASQPTVTKSGRVSHKPTLDIRTVFTERGFTDAHREASRQKGFRASNNQKRHQGYTENNNTRLS